MNSLDAWRNRSMTTRVLDLCEHCKQLKEDVKERRNWWPAIQSTACADCHQKLIREANGVVVC